MKRFLYFKTKTYRSKDYQDYLNQIDNRDNEGSEDAEPELWKEGLQEGEDTDKVQPPKPHIARVAVDPDLIIAYVETYSVEEYAKNKENPKFDCIDIMMADGLNLTVIGTIEEFERMLMALNP